jgi:TetR/AcrR family transcriptional regulator, cholesterol catabolism regulator
MGLPHQDSRRAELLDGAAACFCRLGYQAASIRDLGRELGMTPGGIYAHIASKEELLLAVYAEGVARIGAHVQEAVLSAGGPPVDRFQAALTAHTEFLLSGDDYARVVIRVLPDEAPASVRSRLTRLRDAYEQLFERLVSELPLKPGIDRKLFRLLVLGALNSTQRWYSASGARPREVAGCLFRMITASLRNH